MTSNRTFAELKAAALASKSAAELYAIATESNAKLLKNIGAAQMMSYTHGAAADADHLFQNVIPAQTKVNDEIHAILSAAMARKSTAEVVAIITEAQAA